MPARVALIPARGGSQRIPRKNIREFLGEPVLSRLVRTLGASEVFDSIVVSTDDSEIADVARASGASVPFTRPRELADNHTGARPVIQHAVRELKLEPECTLGVFYPTAVMLQPRDVRESLALFDRADVEFVLSIAEYPAPIARALALDDAGLVTPVSREAQNRRTQDLARSYHDLGQFYWGAAGSWARDGAVVDARTRGYMIEKWRAVDIDTPEDWHRAEMLFRVMSALE